MDVVFPRCAGLDVHKKSVVACVAMRDGGTVSKEVRTFGTTTRQLHALRAWLQESGVTQVAMESTASYWKPVFNLLEAEFTPWVVNPAHIKQVPGRKTDVKDAEWIADLLQHGLLKPSFIPDRAQRELRELTRYRTSLLGERAREVNRIQKVLEGGNIKISSVLSDILGVSGTRMLQALADGESDPVRLAALADERVRATPEALQEALEGLMDTLPVVFTPPTVGPPRGPRPHVSGSGCGGGRTAPPFRGTPPPAADDSGRGASHGRGDSGGDRADGAGVSDRVRPGGVDRGGPRE